MPKTPKKSPKPRNALVATQPNQPLAAIPGTSVVPDAVFRVPQRRPFGLGPWQAEPEKIAWTDPETAYPCIILRQHSGELGGYVGVPPRHELSGFADDALPASINVGLHNPVSYAAACERGSPEAVSICHVRHPALETRRSTRSVAPEHSQAWWFGMIMAGPMDVVPMDRSTSSNARLGERNRAYRDVAFVYREVVELARRLKAIERSASGGMPGLSSPVPRLAAPNSEDGQ